MRYEPVQRRLQFVLEKYGKRTQGDVTLGFFSMANEVFSFDSEDGRYYLKNCLKNNRPDLLALEVDLSHHLNAHGMPCPEVVPDKEGRTIVPYRDQLYLMTRHFDGVTPTWNDKIESWHVEQTFRGLARFHKATDRFDSERDCDRIKSFDLPRISQWLDALEQKLIAEPGREVARQMLALMPRLRELAAESETKIAGLLEACRIQFIHGDFHCFNAFFRDQQLIGCCDFDFIRRDLRLFDFYWGMRIFIFHVYMKQAYGESMWVKEFKPDPVRHQVLLTEAVADCVRAYRQEQELPDSELRYLPLIARMMPLTVVQFFDLENSDEECAEHLEWFTWKLNSLDETCQYLENAVNALV